MPRKPPVRHATQFDSERHYRALRQINYFNGFDLFYVCTRAGARKPSCPRCNLHRRMMTLDNHLLGNAPRFRQRIRGFAIDFRWQVFLNPGQLLVK